jgi:hypothetical protein
MYAIDSIAHQERSRAFQNMSKSILKLESKCLVPKQKIKVILPSMVI